MQRVFNPFIERLPREQLEALRWRRLIGALRRTFACSPFYRQRMQKAGVDLNAD